MPTSSLNPQEIALLQQYQRLAHHRSHWRHRWAVEVVPPLLFVGLWAITGHTVFLLALIAVLVVFNLLRVLHQQRSAVHLGALADRLLAAPGPTEGAPDVAATAAVDAELEVSPSSPRPPR